MGRSTICICLLDYFCNMQGLCFNVFLLDMFRRGKQTLADPLLWLPTRKKPGDKWSILRAEALHWKEAMSFFNTNEVCSDNQAPNKNTQVANLSGSHCFSAQRLNTDPARLITPSYCTAVQQHVHKAFSQVWPELSESSQSRVSICPLTALA